MDNEFNNYSGQDDLTKWNSNYENEIKKDETTNTDTNFILYDNNGANQFNSDNSSNNKKPGNGNKKLKFALLAVSFGLIAAISFQSVNAISDKLFKNNSTQNPITTIAPGNGSGISTTQTAGVQSVTDVSGMVNSVMPSIVSITSTFTTQGYSFFGQQSEQKQEGSGSGFIVGQNKDELLIVTNNHVVDGAEGVKVKFIDDQTYDATIKGTDSSADLAVVAVKVGDLKDDTKGKITTVKLGDSDSVKVGQMAIAIGNALGYGQSVTVGYISAKDREVAISNQSTGQSSKMVLLQTDAAINPGNSGGALLNANGEVVGINSVKYASEEVEGMGYAIPISRALPIINELMNREVLKEDEKGYLGISGKSVSEEASKTYGIPAGVYVNEVADGGAAKEAGLQKGDIITKINDMEVSSIEALKEKANSYRVGTEVSLTIQRSNNGAYAEQKITLKLKGKDTINSLQSGNDTQQAEPEAPNNNQDDQNQDNQDSQNEDGALNPYR